MRLPTNPIMEKRTYFGAHLESEILSRIEGFNGSQIPRRPIWLWGKSGHISVRTHVRKMAEISRIIGVCQEIWSLELGWSAMGLSWLLWIILVW